MKFIAIIHFKGSIEFIPSSSMTKISAVDWKMLTRESNGVILAKNTSTVSNTLSLIISTGTSIRAFPGINVTSIADPIKSSPSATETQSMH